MKLRIKGNSIRFRLSKTEVGKLISTGYIEEETLLPGNKFIYSLQTVEGIEKLAVTFDKNKITMLVPAALVKDWDTNDVVGFNENMNLTGSNSLYLLLEKDFVCLDETTEDQTDNYENPHKAC